MEDLVPLLIFIVIAVINVLKFAVEKSGKKKPASPADNAPRRQTSSLEAFIAKLAEQIEPKPVSLPEWPEGYERPDYMAEMNAYKEYQALPKATQPAPFRKPAPVPAPEPVRLAQLPPAEQSRRTSSLISSIKSTPAIFSGTHGLRMSTPLILSGGTAGTIDFPLKDREKLRQAMLAHLIFSPPRAYDRSFETIIAK